MSSTNKRKVTTARPARAGRPTSTRGTVRRPGGRTAAGRTSARSGRGSGSGGSRTGERLAGPALVVAPVPRITRVTGAVAVLSAVLMLIAPAFAMVIERGGGGVGAAANLFDFVPALLVAGVFGGGGVLCLVGRLPRFGLAVVGAAGGCSTGLLLQGLHLYDSAGRSSRELPLPVALVRSFRFEPALGLRLLIVAHLLAIIVLILAGRAWPRTWMEDEGGFDVLRPAFTGVSFFVGFLATAGVCLAPGSTEVAGIGPPAVLERGGLSGAGGAVFAAALVICAVIAPTLRPRLATVGVYTGLAAVLGGYALDNALLVARAELLTVSLGGALQLLGAVCFAGLAVAAWKLSREPHPA